MMIHGKVWFNYQPNKEKQKLYRTRGHAVRGVACLIRAGKTVTKMREVCCKGSMRYVVVYHNA